MTRRVSVLLSIALLVGAITASPVLAGCDPGRANIAGSYSYGGMMPVSGNTRFRSMTATLDNTAIPYREGGTATRALLEMYNPSTGDKFYAGLRWSPGQGSLGSTQVMVLIDGHGGPLGNGTDDIWYSAPVSQLTSSYTAITITILFEDWGPDELEQYTVFIDGDPDWSVGAAYGPENFTQAKAFSHTANFGSQVPGGSSDVQYFSGVTYTSQYGSGTWNGSSPIATNGNGVRASGVGYAWTRDVGCVIP